MVYKLFGIKIGMTQIFDKSGNAVPVTLLRLEPAVITQIKPSFKGGPTYVQVGYGNLASEFLRNSTTGHMAKYQLSPKKYFAEFIIEREDPRIHIGGLIKPDWLKDEEYVTISGISSGKGFTGLQKRHKFTRGPMTHGSKNHRASGSIGMSATPGRVLPNKKMAGQLGNKVVTQERLKIVFLNLKNNTLVIKGSTPGKRGTLITVSPTK
uniref:Large ribosomal subunit protein uL3c n=1 Tax=Astrosyne radiata TaxID=1158023 RepID=A0A2U9NTC9_9STRA|nr:ribosomal protein L3 [Astrosyne radiata]AWT40348.1 ribosomal protein L3 [Astrosyne radiata]|mmetsp:Transcript_5566/g.12345  ORF Transcript_5566/g.12345 Transcript_5566/m.12345 type:complete len:209 (-) Transcript_5566:464-1090(-)